MLMVNTSGPVFANIRHQSRGPSISGFTTSEWIKRTSKEDFHSHGLPHQHSQRGLGWRRICHSFQNTPYHDIDSSRMIKILNGTHESLAVNNYHILASAATIERWPRPSPQSSSQSTSPQKSQSLISVPISQHEEPPRFQAISVTRATPLPNTATRNPSLGPTATFPPNHLLSSLTHSTVICAMAFAICSSENTSHASTLNLSNVIMQVPCVHTLGTGYSGVFQGTGEEEKVARRWVRSW